MKTLELRRGNDVGIGETILVVPDPATNTEGNSDCVARFFTRPKLAREYLDSDDPWRASINVGYTTGTFVLGIEGAAGTRYEGQTFLMAQFNIVAPKHFEHMDPVMTEPYTSLSNEAPARWFGARFRFTSVLHPKWVNFDNVLLQERVYPLRFMWPSGQRNRQDGEFIRFRTNRNLSSDAAGFRVPNSLRLLSDQTDPFQFDLVLDNEYLDNHGQWIQFETGEIHRHIVDPDGSVRIEIIHRNGSMAQSDAVGPWTNREPDPILPTE